MLPRCIWKPARGDGSSCTCDVVGRPFICTETDEGWVQLRKWTVELRDGVAGAVLFAAGVIAKTPVRWVNVMVVVEMIVPSLSS
jgi:hypothetical protein